MMSYSDNNLITEAVQNYAAALNEGAIEKIVSYYSEDGIFLPDAFKTLKQKEIGKNQFQFLKEKDFTIQYSDFKIDVHDSYAFVEAVAKTAENDLENASKIEKTSRDFFVFRRVGSDWKIVRYIFNNTEETNS